MRGFRVRRIVARALVCAALVGLLAGCGENKDRDIFLYDPSVEGAGEKVFLTFFGFKADALNLTAIEEAMMGFMEDNKDVTITYESIKGPSYYDALSLRQSSGNLDDVFMVDHERIMQLSQAGDLADLSDVPGLENYTEAARSQFTGDDGTVRFLPTCISTYNLYINYDLLASHGQSVPENWQELERVCDYFASQGIVPIVGNNYASLPTLITAKGLFDVYQRPDTDQVVLGYNRDPQGLAQALRPGVEMVREMLDRGWLDPAEVLATDQTSDDLDLFAKGDRPFMVTGGWACVRLPGKGAHFSYGVHPFPILDDGSVLSQQVDTCIALSAHSPNLDEAKAFLAYLIQPDVMWAYCDSQASYTPLKEETRLPSEPALVPSTQCLSNGRVVPRSDYRLELPIGRALALCCDTLLEGGTVEEAMAALSETLNG